MSSFQLPREVCILGTHPGEEGGELGKMSNTVLFGIPIDHFRAIPRVVSQEFSPFGLLGDALKSHLPSTHFRVSCVAILSEVRSLQLFFGQ